jgi:hypothetical protein
MVNCTLYSGNNSHFKSSPSICETKVATIEEADHKPWRTSYSW